MKVVIELTDVERTEFQKHEATIENCISKPFEMGRALKSIKESDLFRETHGTFHDYVESRWKLTKSGAYAKIKAAEVAEIVDVHNEAQATELARLTVIVDHKKKVLDDKKIKAVWKKVLAKKKRQPTQALIREVISEMYGQESGPWFVRRFDKLKSEIQRFRKRLSEDRPQLTEVQVEAFGSIMGEMEALKNELDSLMDRVDEAGQTSDD